MFLSAIFLILYKLIKRCCTFLASSNVWTVQKKKNKTLRDRDKWRLTWEQR